MLVTMAEVDEAKAYIRRLSEYPKIYEGVVPLLHDFSTGIITSPPSLVSKILDLLHGEPDLMHGLYPFLPSDCKHLYCPNNLQETRVFDQTSSVPIKTTNVSNNVKRGVKFVNRVQRKLKKHPRKLRKFYHAIRKYNHDLELLKTKLSVILKKHPGLVTELSEFCCGSNEDKSEGKTGTKKKVLDDIEDTLFQVDMLMSWMKSAKEATQRLFEACAKNPTGRIDVATYLTGMNVRSIESLYGDGTGVTMVELLHESPHRVSSIILPRLSQKLEEIVGKKIEIRSQVKEFHFRRNNCSRIRLIG